MPFIPNVIDGEDIEPTWGNAIRDRTVMDFTTTSARDLAIPAPFDGQLAMVAGRLYSFRSGTGWVLISTATAIDYTPNLSVASGTAPNLGSLGIKEGEYAVAGGIATMWAKFEFNGSGVSGGSGVDTSFAVDVPLPMAHRFAWAPVLTGYTYDLSDVGTKLSPIWGRRFGTTQLVFIYGSNGTPLSAYSNGKTADAGGNAWAAGDAFYLTGSYPIA